MQISIASHFSFLRLPSLGEGVGIGLNTIGLDGVNDSFICYKAFVCNAQINGL